MFCVLHINNYKHALLLCIQNSQYTYGSPYFEKKMAQIEPNTLRLRSVSSQCSQRTQNKVNIRKLKLPCAHCNMFTYPQLRYKFHSFHLWSTVSDLPVHEISPMTTSHIRVQTTWIYMYGLDKPWSPKFCTFL